MQQQIQVLAAESRNVDEQRRQLDDAARAPRRRAKQGLAAPDAARLADAARSSVADGRGAGTPPTRACTSCSEQVPALDEERRAQQDRVNAEAARQADLSARLDALRALQEKVQTEGKLKPWLAKHGLDGLPGPVDPGAHRARLGDGARGGAARAPRTRSRSAASRPCAPSPPTRRRRSWRSTRRRPARIANTHHTLPRLSDLLRLGDAGLKALLNDWLEGVYTAADLDEALAARGKLTHGEVIMTREGHAVSQYAVSFYAPDSEQAGMLARAQEIENLERQLRAQALIADEARSRAGARRGRPTPTPSQRLAGARREAAEAQTARAPAAGRAAAPDAAGRADQRAARPARRRAGRDRRPARGAERAPRDRRGALRGARPAARPTRRSATPSSTRR